MMTTNISQIQSWIKECPFSQRKSKKIVLVSSSLINPMNGLKLRDLRKTHSEIWKMSDLFRFDLKNKLKCVKCRFRRALIIKSMMKSLRCVVNQFINSQFFPQLHWFIGLLNFRSLCSSIDCFISHFCYTPQWLYAYTHQHLENEKSARRRRRRRKINNKLQREWVSILIENYRFIIGCSIVDSIVSIYWPLVMV